MFHIKLIPTIKFKRVIKPFKAQTNNFNIMTPQEIFNALMQGKRVKLTNEKFQELYRDYKKESNEFEIYQIEQHSVNLYFYDEVVYDIQFEDISLF